MIDELPLGATSDFVARGAPESDTLLRKKVSFSSCGRLVELFGKQVGRPEKQLHALKESFAERQGCCALEFHIFHIHMPRDYRKRAQKGSHLNRKGFESRKDFWNSTFMYSYKKGVVHSRFIGASFETLFIVGRSLLPSVNPSLHHIPLVKIHLHRTRDRLRRAETNLVVMPGLVASQCTSDCRADLVLEDTDVINDGKENINPNVGAAGSESAGLDLSAFPPVFRTGEGAQQLLMVGLKTLCKASALGGQCGAS